MLVLLCRCESFVWFLFMKMLIKNILASISIERDSPLELTSLIVSKELNE